MNQLRPGFVIVPSLLVLCFFLAVARACAQPPTPVKVEIRKGAAGYQLFRGGQPYFIKGAGGTRYQDRLAQYGGNSIRTWGTGGGEEVLTTAHRLGLTVTMGLNVASERHGFNYDDTAAVRQQLEKLRGQVRKFKSHPALLIWGIGN